MRQAVERRFSINAGVLIMRLENELKLNLRSFWQIQIVGWGVFYVLNLLESIHFFLTKRLSINEQLVPISIMFLASFALRPICRKLCRSQSWIAFELKAAAAAMGAAIPAGCAACFILRRANSVMAWHAVVSTVMWSFFILFMWCSLYFSIKQWHQSSNERERLLRAESEVKEARLLALRYQLNPHFLFNSLNAVSTLVLVGDAPAATRMLAQIGDLLRTSLSSEVKAEVPLSQELALTKGYLAIEQTRLGERLNIFIVVPLETRNALVPSMLLQPLVENAVRYGVAPFREGGWIAITSALHAGRLRIVIENSGRRGERGETKSGSGIGLGNTADRLKTLYGTDCKLSLAWPEAGGCEVVLELPLRRARSLQEAAKCVF